MDCLLPVKCDAHTLNMISQIGVADMVEYGQVNHVRQEQVIEMLANAIQQVQRQSGSAVQCQVNIRAVFVISFGARAVKNRLFHGRVMYEYCFDFLDDGFI